VKTTGRERNGHLNQDGNQDTQKRQAGLQKTG